MYQATPMSDTQRQSPTCVICQTAISRADELKACDACGAVHHVECWQESNGCGMYGCSNAPRPEPRTSVEIPASYWGVERIPCPSCGKEIQAAAVRCRSCGAVFRAERPLNSTEYRSELASEREGPSLRRGALWLLCLSVLPITAPFAALFGTAWWSRNRVALQKSSTLHAGLAS